MLEAEMTGGGLGGRGFIRGGAKAKGDGLRGLIEIAKVVAQERGIDSAGEVGGNRDI